MTYIDKGDTTHQTSVLVDGLDEEIQVVGFEESQFDIMAFSFRFEGVITDPVTNITYTSADIVGMVDPILFE